MYAKGTKVTAVLNGVADGRGSVMFDNGRLISEVWLFDATENITATPPPIEFKPGGVYKDQYDVVYIGDANVWGLVILWNTQTGSWATPDSWFGRKFTPVKTETNNPLIIKGL